MILFSLGKWNNKGGKHLKWKRIRWHGYVWTPFCHASFRYPSKWELLDRLDGLSKMVTIQMDSGNFDYDEYMWGFANGLILAEAIMHAREPIYILKPKKWLKKGRKKRTELGVKK